MNKPSPASAYKLKGQRPVTWLDKDKAELSKDFPACSMPLQILLLTEKCTVSYCLFLCEAIRLQIYAQRFGFTNLFESNQSQLESSAEVVIKPLPWNCRRIKIESWTCRKQKTPCLQAFL